MDRYPICPMVNMVIMVIMVMAIMVMGSPLSASSTPRPATAVPLSCAHSWKTKVEMNIVLVCKVCKNCKRRDVQRQFIQYYNPSINGKRTSNWSFQVIFEILFLSCPDKFTAYNEARWNVLKFFILMNEHQWYYGTKAIGIKQYKTKCILASFGLNPVNHYLYSSRLHYQLLYFKLN